MSVDCDRRDTLSPSHCSLNERHLRRATKSYGTFRRACRLHQADYTGSPKNGARDSCCSHFLTPGAVSFSQMALLNGSHSKDRYRKYSEEI